MNKKKLKNNKDEDKDNGKEEEHNEEVENNDDSNIFLKWGNIIFNKFVNGLKNNNDIDNIIQLIDCIPYTVLMNIN